MNVVFGGLRTLPPAPPEGQATAGQVAINWSPRFETYIVEYPETYDERGQVLTRAWSHFLPQGLLPGLARAANAALPGHVARDLADGPQGA